ncbi:MAG: tripartite tricarboxylate transporter substrate binding protein [Rhizobiales bacterium]|nr:tripartite tricarboxylate transporter substrate binding protein [Hyphomicrobiales bacterium]
MKKFGLVASIVAATLALAGSVVAQTYPSKPVRIIVPFAAGGAVDTLARLVGSKLSESLGQPVIIENRPGAGGNIASDVVAKSAPDGHTILLTTSGQALSPSLYRSLPYDAAKDLIPVTQLVASYLVLVASPKVPVTSVKELIALAKAKPGGLNYGSTGVGNPLHLTMEMLKRAAGIDLVAVPYRGDAPLNAALIAGQVEVAVLPLATSRGNIEGGRLRGLAVTNAKRTAVLPDLPTIAEAAIPGFESSSWQGFFVPAGTPADIVKRIQSLRARQATFGNEIVGSTPEQFAAVFKAEMAKFARIVEEAKIPKLD